MPGIVCAILAFLIVRAEMALFDLKEGFCATSWGTAKRFCCAPRHRNVSGTDPEVCGEWIEWGEFFDPKAKGGQEGVWIWGGPEFSAYIVFAVSDLALCVCERDYELMIRSVSHCSRLP